MFVLRESLLAPIPPPRLYRKRYRPTFIIFWGERLYKNFPKGYYRTEKIDDTLSLNILKFDIEIPFMYVLHPSSKGFNLQKSTGSVDYINKIRNHLS
jgi:hypothetical protein